VEFRPAEEQGCTGGSPYTFTCDTTAYSGMSPYAFRLVSCG
jgi:hypothetical protein